MLLLSTDLWNYWPVVFFIGAFSFVALLVGIFLYIDKKDLQKKDAYEKAMLAESILVPIEDDRNFWQRFVDWATLKKKKRTTKEEPDVEKYKDNYGKFWSFVIPITVIILVASVSQIDFKKKRSGKKEIVSKKTSSASTTPTLKQILPEKENEFLAGEIKSFELKNFGDDYYPVPVSTKDTVTLNFDGPSGKWSYKTWLHKGKVGYEEIVPQGRPVPGTHTLKVDKQCKILWTSKTPSLL